MQNKRLTCRLMSVLVCLTLLVALLPQTAGAAAPLTLVSVECDATGRVVTFSFNKAVDMTTVTKNSFYLQSVWNDTVIYLWGKSVAAASGDATKVNVTLDGYVVAGHTYGACYANWNGAVKAVDGGSMQSFYMTPLVNNTPQGPQVVSAYTGSVDNKLYVDFDRNLKAGSLSTESFNLRNLAASSLINQPIAVNLSAADASIVEITLLSPPAAGDNYRLYYVPSGLADTLTDTNNYPAEYITDLAVTNNMSGVYTAYINGCAVTATASGGSVTITPTAAQWAAIQAAPMPATLLALNMPAGTPGLFVALGSKSYTTFTLQLTPAMAKSLKGYAIGTNSVTRGGLLVSKTMADSVNASGDTVSLTMGGSACSFTLAYTQNGKTLPVSTINNYAVIAIDAGNVWMADNAVNSCVSRVSGSSKTPVPRSWLTNQTGMAKIATTGSYRFAAPDNTAFVDLTWMAADVTYLNARAVARGTDTTHFSPGKPVKRAEFITLLMRALNFNVSTGSTPQFADVDTKDYYAKSVLQARALGIVGGTGNNKFNPDSFISRQDMAKMLSGVMTKCDFPTLAITTRSASAAYADWAGVATYARSHVDLLYKTGVMRGNGGRFLPANNSTRGEAATVISRILKLEVWN